MEVNVKQVIGEINANLTQQGSSLKDENVVMRAMLNDKDFKVDVYGKDGVVGQICPYEEARELTTSLISKTVSIPVAEAKVLADNHNFTKSEAQNMVNISKEFINTYMETGRKLSLGKREESDISLIPKYVEETTRSFPKKNPDGTYTKGEIVVPAHKSIKVSSPCPEWLKK